MPSTHVSGLDEGSAPFTAKYREIHQAAGMLTVRSNCTIDEALTQLRRQAAEKRCPIEQVAHQVISQRDRREDASQPRD